MEAIADPLPDQAPVQEGAAGLLGPPFHEDPRLQRPEAALVSVSTRPCAGADVGDVPHDPVLPRL